MAEYVAIWQISLGIQPEYRTGLEIAPRGREEVSESVIGFAKTIRDVKKYQKIIVK